MTAHGTAVVYETPFAGRILSIYIQCLAHEKARMESLFIGFMKIPVWDAALQISSCDRANRITAVWHTKKCFQRRREGHHVEGFVLLITPIDLSVYITLGMECVDWLKHSISQFPWDRL